jgi:ribosomal protein S8E
MEYKKNNIMEGIRKRVEIVETDNRDVYTTDLILDNGTVVEVDVQDLFENMIENVSEDTVEDYSVDELLEMFESLKDIINY